MSPMLRWTAPRRGLMILFAGVLAGTAGCGGDSPTAPSRMSPVGRYPLREVGSVRLPAVVHHGPFFDAAAGHFYDQLIATVTDGSMEFRKDGSFVSWLDLEVLADGAKLTREIELDGTYDVVSDVVINVYLPGQDPIPVVIQNGEIAETYDILGDNTPLQYVFRK